MLASVRRYWREQIRDEKGTPFGVPVTVCRHRRAIASLLLSLNRVRSDIRVRPRYRFIAHSRYLQHGLWMDYSRLAVIVIPTDA